MDISFSDLQKSCTNGCGGRNGNGGGSMMIDRNICVLKRGYYGVESEFELFSSDLQNFSFISLEKLFQEAVSGAA